MEAWREETIWGMPVCGNRRGKYGKRLVDEKRRVERQKQERPQLKRGK